MERINCSMNKYIRICFYIIVTVILTAFVCAQLVYPSEREKEIASDNLAYQGTLIWEKTDGTQEQIIAPGNYEVAPGQTMVITTILPDNYNEESIEIRSSQQSVRFYVDGELRLEYDTKDSRPFGSDSASRYVFCKTSYADAGKELRIELVSNAKQYSGVVNEIFCGNKTDIWVHIFSIYGAELISAFFILFFGIITVLISLVLSISYKSKINLEFLGWGVILGAIWLLGESKMRQLIIPNVSILSSLCFVVVMLCPVPVLLYVDSVQNGRYRKLFHTVECMATLNLIVSSILQFAEIADYLDTLFVSHLILGISFVSICVTFFLDYRNGRIKEYLLSVVGICCGMVGTLIETISVYFVVSLSGFFLVAGLFLLLFFTIIKTIRDVRNLENERNREKNENRRKQMEAMSLQMMQTLSTTIEAKDEYINGHSRRVAEYSALIARELGWNDKEVENLRNAAHLHDIGKIGVPDIILNKPTGLLDTEYELVKKHTVIGADILKSITLIEHVQEVAKYHHERYDGSGYPNGLKGEEIPIHARIVAMADSYDAMASKRIYRDALPESVIRQEILANRGTQFDPAIADVLLKLLDGNWEKSLTNQEFVEVEVTGTTEADKFISDVVNTMKSQKNAESIDFLTGLPMRNLGERLIAQKMQVSDGCLTFFDMDNLKKVNDIYGHKYGDQVLKLLGNTIAQHAENGITCRLGGDEFLLFLPEITKEEAEECIGRIFESFTTKKENEVEIRDTSLSAGLCECLKGEPFAECYVKADKALYYVKQNGKNMYAFYHQIEQENEERKSNGRDLEQVVKALRKSGNYMGALDLENREFSKIYEYVSNLGERYKHTCHLVMITMDVASDDTIFIDKIEHALGCMEKAIHDTIRNVDVCTRYSSMQYLLILMEVGEDNIPQVVDRIFSQYYKVYGGNDFLFRYEYIPMLEKE